MAIGTIALFGCQAAGIKNPLKQSSTPTYELQQKIMQSYTVDGPPTPAQDALLLFKETCLAGLSDATYISQVLKAKSARQYTIMQVDAQFFVGKLPNLALLTMTNNNWHVENLQSGQRYFIILNNREQCMFYTNQLTEEHLEEFHAFIPKLSTALNVEIKKFTKEVSLQGAVNRGKLNAYTISAWDDRIDKASITLIASDPPGGLSMYSFQQHPDNYPSGLKYTPHYIRKKDSRSR